MKRIIILIALFIISIVLVGCFEKDNKTDDTNKDGVIDWNDLDPSGDNKNDDNTEDPNGENQNGEDPNGNNNTGDPVDDPNGNNNENPNPDDRVVKEIKITIDTEKYTGTIEGDSCTVEVSHDKSYTYLFATVKTKAGYSIASDVKLYVNGELKEYKETFDKYIYTINETSTELEYKIKDPNWTPVY